MNANRDGNLFTSVGVQPSNGTSYPRLRVLHLLVCATVAAVQLSIWGVFHPQAGQYMAVAVAMKETIRQSLDADGLTFAVFAAYWHINGYAEVSQPGQCLLLGRAIPRFPSGKSVEPASRGHAGAP